MILLGHFLILYIIFVGRNGLDDFLGEMLEINGMVDAIQTVLLQKVKERSKPMSL